MGIGHRAMLIRCGHGTHLAEQLPLIHCVCDLLAANEVILIESLDGIVLRSVLVHGEDHLAAGVSVNALLGHRNACTHAHNLSDTQVGKDRGEGSLGRLTLPKDPTPSVFLAM